ncbi:MAG: di-trans,poly-cis-decaprenylcistransferase [Spirochaetes bacterium GWB1_59_5]|nr:MAG: di-trans,poly-cis-decaprenylcistransferase [Spirochaetes bacterium GWB1_59_5]
MQPTTNRESPAHVAIFMDGNGRWAKARGLPRTEGHREGLKAAKRIVKAASSLGIKNLTLYTFSTENWKRAQEEVKFLMSLVSKYLCAELDFYKENLVRVVHSGDLEGLPPDVREAILQVVSDTADFDGIRVNLAINYGGRDEILRAMSKLPASSIPCTEAEFRNYLDIPDMPDPDLIIRAGGELRLSNFLIWQAAYSELYFSDTLWPDWTETHLVAALEEYARRERRFGDAR